MLAVTCRGSPVAHDDLKTIYVWDLSKGKEALSDGKPLLRLKGHERMVHAVKGGAASNVSRRIDVPSTARGYQELKSQVIHSWKEFDALVERVKGAGLREDDQTAFLKALADAKIDFTRESLVLIRHTESEEDRAQVTFAPAVLSGDTLVCVIHRELPGAGRKFKIPDEGGYCFALAVEKDKVKNVDVSVSTTGDD